MENAENTRTFGFVTLSAMAHAAVLVAVTLIHIQKPTPKIEIIELEMPTLGQQMEVLPMAAPQADVSSAESAQPKAEVAQVEELPPAPQKVVSTSVVKSSPIAEAAPVVLDAPDLEVPAADDLADSSSAQLAESEITEKFDEIDNEHATKVAALASELDTEKEKALAEKENLFAEAQKAQREEDERLAAAQKAKAQAEKAALLNRIAEQRKSIEAETAAREKSRKEQQAQAEAEAAEENAKAQARASVGNGQGIAQSGQGNVIAPSVGIPEGVRALEDLKQLPGNQKPTYPQADRLAGNQGEVSFLAYVLRDGSLGQFKMLKSSGHRSLDLRTLAAIRSWRFYPGQEGWVEIPFKWDLRGGPQELPATLRTKVSSN
ncbi:MAG: TonB family protein [Pseudobdellovibrionaceae bacterium]